MAAKYNSPRNIFTYGVAIKKLCQFSPALYTRAMAKAEADGVTFSELVRTALVLYINGVEVKHRSEKEC
ncbi:MAG: hypothetical protein KGL39_18935 [Patescibacteria group bacterium]|nr:hypothetical protein [Patescibacteria group bacterium]